MSLEHFGQVILALDFLGILWLAGVTWIDLRHQSSDAGRVGGVVVLAALVYVLFLIGRALFSR